MQDEEDIEWGRKYTSSRECFPMICTTGSFLKKLHEPGIDPGKTSFFMPSHRGPCRFGQYNKLQRIIMENLGFKDVEIISPSNKNSYADFSRGQGIKFRLVAWKGLVSAEVLGKLRQERKPYEAVPGKTEEVYQHYLDKLVRSVEVGARDTLDVLKEAGEAFKKIELLDVPQKPVIAVVGEIFMRDNPYCSGFLKQRLESLGAETYMAPAREWIELSSLRYREESIWREDWRNVLKATIQRYFQHRIDSTFKHALADVIDSDRVIHIEDILELSAPYIHRDYVGDPPLALGVATGLAKTGISGVANILPFTCLPGTIVTSLSAAFRKDHDDMPWVDIAFDGQEDTGIETRLQAFVHQAKQYAKSKGHNKPKQSN
jgi:predicted nucleotide-binding protein (sugar kinase/HSP70/actin superfamily)